MRLIPINCIKEGSILGKKLQNSKGDILLREGVVLDSNYINKIINYGISSLYIEDEFSENIEVKEVINDELRTKAVDSVKNIFIQNTNDERKLLENFKAITAMVESIIAKILDNNESTLDIVDLKLFDEYTYYHSVNVAVISLAIGIALKLDNEQLKHLGIGAILHDFGKVFIDKNILNKNGKLTDNEFGIIKNHSRLGYDFLKEKLSLSSHSHMVILQHHEKWNGNGYPLKLSGNRIHSLARIVSVADVYDALTSDRPYRKAMLPSDGFEMILSENGTSFDPEIVNIFKKKIAPYPVGSQILLSNGYAGIVSKNLEDYGTRPKIRIVKEKDVFITPYELDLMDHHNLNIVVKEMLKEIL